MTFSTSSGADKFLSFWVFSMSCSFSRACKKLSFIPRLAGDCFPAVFMPGPHPGFHPICKAPHQYWKDFPWLQPYPRFGPPATSTAFDYSEATFPLLLCDRTLLPCICNCSRNAISRIWTYFVNVNTSLGLLILLPGFLVLLSLSL